MSQADNEREQVEWVFGLTGGELDSRPLLYTAPDRWGDEIDCKWKYHYDGFPEWASEDFPERFEQGGEVDFFTLVEVGCTYESRAPKWLRTSDGRIYVRVRQYGNSGETECPEGPSGGGETVGEGRTEGMDECPLCEEKKGGKHGYIYLGEGCESVYKHVEFACARCEWTREDTMLNGAPTQCDCEEWADGILEFFAATGER
jgi:hypothetical protein